MDKILEKFGLNRITGVVKISNSFVEVTKNLGLDPYLGHNRINIERCIKRLDISTEHFGSVKRIRDSKERWNKDKLEELVKKCNNLGEILSELDILPISTNYNNLKKYLKEFDIDYTHLKSYRNPIKNNWNEENLRKNIKNSNSQKEVLEKMNIRAAGSNFKTLHKYILLYNINTDHFKKNYEEMLKLGQRKKALLSDILIEHSKYDRKTLKKRLYEEGLKERKCEQCQQNEEWMGKKMSMILDHINGIHDDDRIENLRILCPNCNATLDTHCGKNFKNKKI